MKIIYTGIFLGKSEMDLLKELEGLKGLQFNSAVPHCTLQFRPSTKQVSDLPLGKAVEVRVIGVGCSDRVAAVKVALGPELQAHFGGKVPHVTLWVAPGAKPVEAGELNFQPLSKQGISVFGRVGVWKAPGEISYGRLDLPIG